jgi:hypothetical protein
MLRERQQLLRALVRDGHIHSAFQYIPLSPLSLHRAMRTLDGTGAVEDVAQTWIQLGMFSNNTVLGLPSYVYPAMRDDRPGVSRVYVDADSFLVFSGAPTTHVATPVRIAELGEGIRAVSDTFLHPISEEEFHSHNYESIINHCPNGTTINSTSSFVYGEHANVAYTFCDVTHRALHRPDRRLFNTLQTSSTGFQYVTPKTTGVINLLVLPVDFSDNAGYPVTGGATFLNSYYGTGGELDRFYRDNSQGIFGVKATIVPLVRAPRTMSWYNAYNNYLDVCIDEVLQKAYAMGYNPRLYDDWVLVTKYVGLGYAGLSFVGSSGTHTNGQYTHLMATAHELGHNFGRLHSHLKSPYSEYGNTLEMMGYAYGNVNAHFGALTKVAFGWLNYDLHVIQVQRTTGVYRLYCMDHPGSYGQRLIQLGYTHQKRAFWLEYRYLNGFGSIGTSKWPYPKSLITRPLVQGALVLEDFTGKGGDSTLIDATPSTVAPANGPQTDATIAVGKTYNIGQEGVPTNTAFATVKVLAAGGTEQDSYLDIQLTFGATDICPFPKTYPTELCTSACTYTQGVATTTLLYFMGSDRAWSFTVPSGQQFSGLGSVDIFVYAGSMTNVAISVWTNSNSKPGILLAKATYGKVVSQASPRINMVANDALNKLQLSPGTYWLSFLGTQYGSSAPWIFYSPTIADGLPSYQKSGTSWVTDSPAREVYVSVSAKCASPVGAAVRMGVREIPATVKPNTRFYLTALYMDTAGHAAKPPAGRTVRATLYRVSGAGTLSGVLTATTVSYSAAVTIPKLMISSAGSYMIDVSDGTLSVRSATIVVSTNRQRRVENSTLDESIESINTLVPSTSHTASSLNAVSALTSILGGVAMIAIITIGFIFILRRKEAVPTMEPIPNEAPEEIQGTS